MKHFNRFFLLFPAALKLYFSVTKSKILIFRFTLCNAEQTKTIHDHTDRYINYKHLDRLDLF